MGTAVAEPEVKLLTVAEFAAAIGKTYEWAYARVAKGEWVKRDEYPRGKLTTYRVHPDQVQEYRRRVAQGLPV